MAMERLQVHRQPLHRSSSKRVCCELNPSDQNLAQNGSCIAVQCPKTTMAQEKFWPESTTKLCALDPAVQERLGQDPYVIQQRLQNCERCYRNKHEKLHLSHQSTTAKQILMSSTSIKTELNSRSIIFYVFLFCFLIGSAYAHPTKTNQSSKSDFSKRKFSLSSKSIDHSDHVSINRVRNIRSALTPPVKADKTTPTKREISAVLTNSHRDPQRLASKSGFYVEIKKNGKVKGTRKESVYSKLKPNLFMYEYFCL